MFKNEPVVVSIHVVGDVTGETYTGDFSFKPFLSCNDRIRADRIRRELLGANADEASEGASDRAWMVGQLAIRTTKSDDWWKSKEGGLQLIDENVLVAVYEAAMKVEKDAVARVKAKSDEAKKTLGDQVKAIESGKEADEG